MADQHAKEKDGDPWDDGYQCAAEVIAEAIRALADEAPTAVECDGWHITYDNDTGPGDEGFWEWWDVIRPDGSTICRCNSEADANTVLRALADEVRG